jgi:hypothetical protein
MNDAYPDTLANVAKWFYTVSQIVLAGGLANLFREAGPRPTVGIFGVVGALVLLFIGVVIDRRAERLKKGKPHG